MGRWAKKTLSMFNFLEEDARCSPLPIIYTINTSTQEAEAGCLQVGGQPGLYSE